MADEKRLLCVSQVPTPRAALSLVHARGRIDVAAGDILRIEALAEQTFFVADTWTSHTYQLPHVCIEFAWRVGARIQRLTSQIVDEELAIVVDGEVVVRPVMREPTGLRDTMMISANDMEEAKQLAGRLRRGWIKPGLRVV